MTPEDPDKELFKRLSKEINRYFGCIVSSTKQANIEILPTTIYSNTKLYTLTDFSCLPAIKYMLFDNGQNTILLDGSSQAWEILNTIEEPKLTIKNVYEYLSLYISTTSFPYEVQKIVNCIDDIDFTEYPTESLLNLLSQHIQPPVFLQQGKTFTIYCNLIVQNNLFHAAFDIQEDGRVDLIDRKLLLTELPVGSLVLDF